MFYTLIEMFVYNLMLPFHKIWDITKFSNSVKLAIKSYRYKIYHASGVLSTDKSTASLAAKFIFHGIQFRIGIGQQFADHIGYR